MKIAVLTFPLANNYGGNLQAFAMLKMLENLEHEPILVNLKFKQNIKFIIKYLIKKYFLFFISRYKNPAFFTQSKIFAEFSNKFITPKTAEIFNMNELKKLFETENFDACVVGSDQVFSTMSFCDFRNIYSLGFCDDIIKISYAASFGGDKFSGKDVEINRVNLQKFMAISVREKSGIKVCKETFGVKATYVLDPTLMIDKSEYERTFANLPSKSSGKIFAYILDKNQKNSEILRNFAKEQNLEIYEINDGNNAKEIISPSEWLKAINDAKIVVTDSFHGCVFSIIFGKEFYCFTNLRRGKDRFFSLFETFDLQNRIISEKIVKSEINYEKVYEKLAKMQEISKEFLMQNLKR